MGYKLLERLGVTAITVKSQNHFKSIKKSILLIVGLHESNTIQYFCNYCLVLVNS